MPKVFSQTDSKDFYSGIGIQDAGLSAGPIGQDKRYQALYDANPYRSLTYNRSGWQALMSALGFRTDYDRWSEEAQVNAAEYDAQIAQMQMQNEFNSPEEQAARMREAGLNPDLLGTQGVSDSASPVQDVNGMSPNQGDEFTQLVFPVVSSFVSRCMDSVSKGFVFAKDLIQLQKSFDNQDLDMLSKINSIADSYLRDRVSFADAEDSSSFEGRQNFLSHGLGSGVPYRKSVAYELGIPRRLRRSFEKAVSDKAYSLAFENDIWSQAVQRNKSKAELSRQRVSLSENGIDSVMDTYWRGIQSANDEIRRIKSEFDKQSENLREGQLNILGAKQDFEQMYWDTMNESDGAKAKAGQDQSSYWVNFYKNSVSKILHQTTYKITKGLQDDADHGSTFAKGCLFAWSLSELLNFGLGDALDFAGQLINPFGLVGKGLDRKFFPKPVKPVKPVKSK